MIAIARRHSAWLWLAGAFLAIGLVRLATQGSAPPPALAASSASADGGLALRLFLRHLGHQVTVRSSSLDPCVDLTYRDMLLVGMAGADLPPSATADCMTWMRGGGRVVVVTDGSTAAPLLDGLNVHVVPTSAELARITEPLLLHPPVSRIVARADAVIANSRPGATLAAVSTGAVIERFLFIRGDLWVITAPAVFENANLSLADNASLAASLAPPGSRVVFEQYSGASAAVGAARGNWLQDSAWGVAALFAFFSLLLYRGMSGVRLGPPVRPLRETHRPAIEYVQSMAGTLRYARKGADVLRLYQLSLRRAMRERAIGESADPEDERLAQDCEALLQTPERLTDDELRSRAERIVQMENRLEGAGG